MLTIQSDWNTIKANYKKGWRLFYQINRENNTPILKVFCLEHTGVVSFEVDLLASSDDYTEFIDKYKNISNLSNTSIQGKINTYSSPRPQNTSTYYCGVDDDVSAIDAVGGGNGLCFEHKIGEPVIQTFYRNFNVIENITYLHDAVIGWQNAIEGKISGQIVPSISTVVPGVNTIYQSYGDIVLPSAGTGDIDVTNIQLVESPVDSIGNRAASFWDADYNASTKTFENIRGNALGLGQFNIFQNEIVLKQFLNKIHMMGSRNIKFDSKDIERLWHGMRFKFILETDNTIPDHDWETDLMMFLYRERTK